ncbi:MAG: HAMP domain-containing sensor histidine kinase, partial [Verrucomicrobiota bacterium]
TIARSGPWNFAALWILEPSGELSRRAIWRASDADAGLEQENQGKTPRHAIASEKPVWSSDLSIASAEKTGNQSAFAFPLRGSRGIGGAIELVGAHPIAPDDDLLALAGAFGIQVGLYLERKQTELELQQQKETAEEANLAKDRFLAALSHELRTPLNPVLMWACATLEEPRLDAEMREGLQMIRRNVELEARLIDDLLDHTRISQGKLRLKLQPVRADTLLQHALEIVRAQMEDKQLEVNLDLQASNHLVLADATRIQQVFWNLLRNAEKFTPAKGRIDISSYDAQPGVLGFTVKDSGRGISPETMPKLFVAFEQGDSNGDGLGLGLAICRAIVRMHGGKISAASDGLGTGATFTLELKTVPEIPATGMTRSGKASKEKQSA